MKLPRNLTMSPNQELRMPPSKTIGYFGGSFPSVVVWMNGDPLELKLGQCIPCDGYDVTIQNHFDRTGSVLIVHDAPVNLIADGAGAEGLNTYYGNYRFRPADAGAGDNAQSFGVMLTKGRAKVTIYTDFPASITSYAHADAAFLDSKPAGLDDTIDLRHPSGDSLSGSCRTVAGYYGDGFLTNWVAASGFSWEDRLTLHSHYAGESVFYIESGMALFGSGAVLDGRVNLTVEYLGKSGMVGV